MGPLAHFITYFLFKFIYNGSVWMELIFAETETENTVAK